MKKRLPLTSVFFGLGLTHIAACLKPLLAVKYIYSPGMTRYSLIIFSFTGTNLEALINSTKKPTSFAQIVLVVSNKAGVEGLKKAERAGIPTRVGISHLF